MILKELQTLEGICMWKICNVMEIHGKTGFGIVASANEASLFPVLRNRLPLVRLDVMNKNSGLLLGWSKRPWPRLAKYFQLNWFGEMLFVPNEFSQISPDPTVRSSQKPSQEKIYLFYLNFNPRFARWRIRGQIEEETEPPSGHHSWAIPRKRFDLNMKEFSVI